MLNISFEKLRVFHRAARIKNFSKAARELFVTEGAVSQQIRDLEWKLGKKLFHRHGPKVKLTAEGELLFALLDPLVNEVDGLIENFMNLANSTFRGSLKIAATQSIILNLLPSIIRKFEEENSDVNLVLFNLPPPEINDAVLEGSVDLGISPLFKKNRQLVTKELVRFPWILLTLPGHPLSAQKKIGLKDIASFPIIMPSGDIPSYTVLERVAKAEGLNLKVSMRTARWEVIKKYVEIGLGIAIVPKICVSQSEKEKFWFARVDHLLGCLPIILLTNSRKTLSSFAAKFSDILVESCKEIYPS